MGYAQKWCLPGNQYTLHRARRQQKLTRFKGIRRNNSMGFELLNKQTCKTEIWKSWIFREISYKTKNGSHAKWKVYGKRKIIVCSVLTFSTMTIEKGEVINIQAQIAMLEKHKWKPCFLPQWRLTALTKVPMNLEKGHKFEMLTLISFSPIKTQESQKI